MVNSRNGRDPKILIYKYKWGKFHIPIPPNSIILKVKGQQATDAKNAVPYSGI